MKMNPTASNASSLWRMVATFTHQPGRKIVKNSGNQSSNPVDPMMNIPQKTAK